MAANLLTLNSSKTEFLFVGPKKNKLVKYGTQETQLTQHYTRSTQPQLHLWRTPHLFRWDLISQQQSLSIPAIIVFVNFVVSTFISTRFQNTFTPLYIPTVLLTYRFWY